MTALQARPQAAEQEAPVSAAPPAKRKKKSDRAGYIFLLPWFGGVLLTFVPFFISLYLAFTDYDLLTPPKFTGLDNIKELLADEKLHQSLGVTFTYTFISVPISLAAALLVAVVLNKGMRGLPIYRSIYYLPSLLGGSVAIVMLWRAIFGADGIVNHMLSLIGIEHGSWIQNPDTALGVLVSLEVWSFGSPMVIFLAALRQVPQELYEAAAVDGAKRGRQFWSITLPMISPVIFFNLVLALIGALQTFTQAFVVSGGTGGPAGSTMFYNLYLYQEGFTNFNMGYASAMAWLLLLIIAAFTGINFYAQRFWVHYEN